jgi:hypothetical protein
MAEVVHVGGVLDVGEFRPGCPLGRRSGRVGIQLIFDVMEQLWSYNRQREGREGDEGDKGDGEDDGDGAGDAGAAPGHDPE